MVPDRPRTLDLRVIHEPADNSLTVQFRPIKGEFTPCFVIPDVSLFLPPSPKISIGLFLGTLPLSIVSVTKLRVEARPHALSVDNSLLVSSHLTQEIIDKVKSLDRVITADTETLDSIRSAQIRTLKRFETLDYFVRDLYAGTRIFQERMTAILTDEATEEATSGQSALRYGGLIHRVNRLMSIHRNIGERVHRIQETLDTRRLLEIASVSFDVLDRTIDQLLDALNKGVYDLFLTQTTGLTDLLAIFKLEKALKKAEASLKDHPTGGSAATIGVVLGLALVVWLATVVVLRKVSAAQAL